MVHLVVCGAPPAAAVTELVGPLHRDGWGVCVIPTTSALDWLDVRAIEQLTGYAVQAKGRKPLEEKRLPRPNLVVAAPAALNTISKWALGINDTPALGVLNEALGSGLPIVASPYVKPALAAHPAFHHHLDVLSARGVRLTETEALRPADPIGPFRWQCVLDLVRSF